MKKLLFITLIAFGINAKAQIMLENVYAKGNFADGRLRIHHLTSAGYKYSMRILNGSSVTIKLYDLNHSLYKTINVPVMANATTNDVWYISDELFNTNPSDIEYLVIYTSNTSSNVVYTRIYDENSNLIFSVDTLSLPLFTGASNDNWSPIYYTSSGVKMILYRPMYIPFADSNAYVYSLPGKLPCNDCTNGVVSGLAPNGGGYGNKIGVSNSYPNPAINSTRIDYAFPNGVNEGEIVFYDLQGKDIKRYKVDKTFDHLLISTADIPAGTYFYQMQTAAQASEGKKMVVIK